MPLKSYLLCEICVIETISCVRGDGIENIFDVICISCAREIMIWNVGLTADRPTARRQNLRFGFRKITMHPNHTPNSPFKPMSRNLSDILREGEVVLHTCYGTTYKAFFRGGYLVDEVDPVLRYTSPTAFANAHLERGKANGWDKCKVERDGVATKLKNLPVLQKPVIPKGPIKLSDLKKAKALAVATTTANINQTLTTSSMPTKATPTEKPKKPRVPRTSTSGAKKTCGGGAGEPSKSVYIPEPEPTVIYAKVVEGTDGYMDVCYTQLMELDYFKYEGVLYYKEANTQEVFEISPDKSIGPRVGVWDKDTCVIKVPYVECDDE